MKKHLLGFLAGGDPARGSVGVFPQSFYSTQFPLPMEQTL
jgi:hypothetical protein